MKSKRRNGENQLAEVSDKISEAARQLGQHGGIVTRDRYAGTDFYRRIGAKGGRKTAALYHDLLAEFGRKGGRPRRPALNEFVGEEDRNREEAGRPSDPLLPPEL